MPLHLGVGSPNMNVGGHKQSVPPNPVYHACFPLQTGAMQSYKTAHGEEPTVV